MASVLNISQIPPKEVEKILQSPEFRAEFVKLGDKAEKPVIDVQIMGAWSLCSLSFSFKQVGIPINEYKQLMLCDWDNLDLMTIQKMCDLIMSVSCNDMLTKFKSDFDNQVYVEVIEKTVHLFNDCAKILNDIRDKCVVTLYNRHLLTGK
jgi:hypothetical protein